MEVQNVHKYALQKLDFKSVMHRLVCFVLLVQAQFFTRLIRLENDDTVYVKKNPLHVMKVAGLFRHKLQLLYSY